ncbi:RNA-binding S4 domain-containing protein [Inquilinus sp.]|uniref:RNA-binding S4 domain-containing protein n=1 Tax=Inquilinus sp. TaxID=1932117 RepID=UPI0031DD4CAB
MAERGAEREETERPRLDKWLWQARFFKTRSLAAKVCAAGGIRIDGVPTQKAHAAIRPGMVLTFVQGRHIRVIEIVALGERRGPASEAQGLYRDLQPPTPEAALPPSGGPRPTGRDRRALPPKGDSD